VIAEAGADSWKGLKKLAKRLRDTRRRPTGPSIAPSPPHIGALHIRDQFGNLIQEPLYPELPPNEFWRAWQHIGEPDWSQLGAWFVAWDHHKQAWSAFEPSFDSTRHVYWDRELAKWTEYTPDFSPPSKAPSLRERVRQLLRPGDM
jgi:hypothetical protein